MLVQVSSHMTLWVCGQVSPANRFKTQVVSCDLDKNWQSYTQISVAATLLTKPLHRLQRVSHRRPFTGFSEASGRLRKTGKRASIGIRPEWELNPAPLEQLPKTATVTTAPSKLAKGHTQLVVVTFCSPVTWCSRLQNTLTGVMWPYKCG